MSLRRRPGMHEANQAGSVRRRLRGADAAKRPSGGAGYAHGAPRVGGEADYAPGPIPEQRKVRRTGSARNRFLVALPYLVIAVGLVVLVQPIANAWWEAWQAARNIQEVSSVYDTMNDPERSVLYEDALRYNELLASERTGKPVSPEPILSETSSSGATSAVSAEVDGGSLAPADADSPAGAGAPAGSDTGLPDTPGYPADAASSPDDNSPDASDSPASAKATSSKAASAIAPYERQLSFRGSEMIAYISIPKCSIRLPIFHGTEDKELAAGVGHLKGSSLPAGGPSTHCVLTAHSALPGKRMFDDIVLLEPGDRFVVWVLGRPLAYEVTGSDTVLPDQTDSLVIRAGEDLVTLVTCTPYGVNSHRLLVHAERCDYIPDEEAQPDAAVYVNSRTAPLLAALGALVLLAVVLAVRRRKRRRLPR